MNQFAQLRLANQWLANSKGTSAADVVKHMGAMQAQNYQMAKWAIASRVASNLSDNTIEAAFNRNEILRTHVLRPTWHFVHPHDIRWMLALTGPRLKKSLQGYWKKAGLSQSDLNQTKRLLEKKLEQRNFSARDVLKTHLEEHGKAAYGRYMSLILMDAELDGFICSAGRTGNQFAYGLIDEIVPKTPLKSREEALATLALRYFTAHGPASVNDFSWWSGLTLTDCKKAIAFIEPQLCSETIDQNTFWTLHSNASIAPSKPALLTLAAFDEFLVGYRDRSAVLPAHHTKKVITINGLFHPTIVRKGQVIGTWSGKRKAKSLMYNTSFFPDVDPPSSQNVKQALTPYARFLDDTINLEEE